jgi:hypothetical protein
MYSGKESDIELDPDAATFLCDTWPTHDALAASRESDGRVGGLLDRTWR